MKSFEINQFTDEQLIFLLTMAEKFVWWKSPHQAIRYPQKVIAQVLNIGDIESVRETLQLFGEDTLREVIRSAEIGQFSDKSWSYWNVSLGLAVDGAIPEQPKRETHSSQ